LEQIGEQIVLVVPPRFAVVGQQHELGVALERLDSHPDLAQGQTPMPVVVEPPAVGIADVVDTRQIRFYSPLALGVEQQP
jgi:hypothetical protein